MNAERGCAGVPVSCLVNFTGNFGSIAGHILGDHVTLQGSSDATISGSIIAM